MIIINNDIKHIINQTHQSYFDLIFEKSLNIDTLITNDVYTNTKNLDKIYELLNLPEKYCFPLVMVGFGYPKEEPSYIKGRLKEPGVIHRGKYNKYSKETLSEIVSIYDNKENHINIIENWKEKGFDNYLKWFYEKWIIAIENEKVSKEIIIQLKKHGFTTDFLTNFQHP